MSLRLVVDKPSLRDQQVLLPWPRAQQEVMERIAARKRDRRWKHYGYVLLHWAEDNFIVLVLLAVLGVALAGL
jgi:hypothetical protein